MTILTPEVQYRSTAFYGKSMRREFRYARHPSVFTSQCSKALPCARMKDEKGTAFKPYLSRRHVFKRYVSICQLTGCYPHAVNVGFCIVTLEILDEKEKKN